MMRTVIAMVLAGSLLSVAGCSKAKAPADAPEVPSMTPAADDAAPVAAVPAVGTFWDASEAEDRTCGFWKPGGAATAGSEVQEFLFVDLNDATPDYPVNSGRMQIDGELRDLNGVSQTGDETRMEVAYTSVDGLYDVTIIRAPVVGVDGVNQGGSMTVAGPGGSVEAAFEGVCQTAP